MSDTVTEQTKLNMREIDGMVAMHLIDAETENDKLFVAGMLATNAITVYLKAGLSYDEIIHILTAGIQKRKKNSMSNS